MVSPPTTIRIGGYVPLTTIDYPGLLAAVVFLSGCPWNCPYCHNQSLRDFHYSGGPSWEEILAHLQKRRGLLEGVVFSGGEPTAQDGLPHAMKEIKSLGFSIGLHTGGAYPGKFKKVLPLVDWVGFDVKAPPDKRYDRLTGKPDAATNFLRSLEILRDSGVAFTLRTTVDPAVTCEEEFAEIKAWLASQGLPQTVRQTANA